MTEVLKCAGCRWMRIVQDGAFIKHTDRQGNICVGSYLTWQEAVNVEHDRLRNERLDDAIDRRAPTVHGVMAPENRRTPGEIARWRPVGFVKITP